MGEQTSGNREFNEREDNVGNVEEAGSGEAGRKSCGRTRLWHKMRDGRLTLSRAESGLRD